MAEDGLMEQLAGFLSSEDGMKQLQNAARMLGLGEPKPPEPPRPEPGTPDGLDPQMMMKVMRLARSARQDTPSSAFLRALKPLLKEERQAKVDDAIRMMQFFSILPMLKEMG